MRQALAATRVSVPKTGRLARPDKVLDASLPTTWPSTAIDCQLPVGMVVRLLNASPEDVAAAAAQLGASIATAASASARPILSIDYGQREAPSTVRAMPLGAGVGLAVADGRPIIFQCRPGQQRIPLLNVILRLSALSHDAMPLHAAAVEWRGRGILIVGAAGSGKSALFLGLTSMGAEWVDAEWVYLKAGSVHGSAGAAQIREGHVRQVPGLARGIPVLTRLRLQGVGIVAELAKHLQRSVPRSHTVRSLASRLDRWSSVEVGPAGAGTSASQPRRVVPLDAIVAVRRSGDARAWLEETDATSVVDEVVDAQLETYRRAQVAYQRFQATWPAERIDILHDLPARVRSGLLSTLAGRPVHVLQLPGRYDLNELRRLADVAVGSLR